MLLIEADGKALLRSAGIAVSEGIEATSATDAITLPGAGPWFVKAQVPVGGRGKAGGVVRCASETEVRAALKRLLGSSIKGHAVQSCLIESAVDGADEVYLSLLIDPAQYAVRVMLVGEGGVDVEHAAFSARRSRLAEPDAGAIAAAVNELADDESHGRWTAIAGVGERLAQLFMRRDLMLAEINPLFVSPNGCIAGDAKIVVDLDAMHRQPELRALIEGRAAVYPEAMRKLHEGFDYVEVDPQGEIGLLTTGAGLSMMLIDQMIERGRRPLNFCDIRTGLLRGDPARLIKALEWIGSRPSVKVVLVNIFAGITDLSEFAKLLCVALDRVPAIKAPIVARIVGNRFEEARAILAEMRPDIAVYEDLTAALVRLDAFLDGTPA